MIDFGTIRPGTTLYIPFATYDSNDPTASVTMTGLATTDIEVYKDGSVTQRASDAGYTLLDTDGTDFDTITGIHGISIDLADNTTAGFYEAGSQYWIVLASVTVDAGTINGILATFRIGYPDAILNTSIATLASQTSFTLSDGPTDDDALNNTWAIIHDVASAAQWSKVWITDYVGSTKTVTLNAGATFTVAATDNISVMAPIPVQINPTAQIALEDQYDGTGLVGDTYPATQSQVSGLSIGSAALSVPVVASPGGFVLTTGSEVNNEDSTRALDGIRHELSDTAGTLDCYYIFDIGPFGKPVSVTFESVVNGGNDTFNFYANIGSSGTPNWSQRGTVTGTGSTSNVVIEISLFEDDVLTDDPTAVWIRINGTGLTTSSFDTDRLSLARSVLPQYSGYDNGSVWVDTTNGTAGTVLGYNGIASRPVLTFADAITIATALGVHRYEISNDSSITLASSTTGNILSGRGWTLALGGQDISNTHVIDSKVSGVGTGTAVEFHDCRLTTVTLPGGEFHNCSVNGVFTCTGAGTYHFHQSHSGSTTPTFDLGAAVGNTTVLMHNWKGAFSVDNLGATGTDVINLAGDGEITLNASCVGGTVNIQGNWTVTNNGSGITINYDDNTSNITAILADTADMQPKLGTPAVDISADIATVDTNVDAVLVDTNELQTDWTNGGRLDLILDAILAMLDDPRAEPGQGTPAVNADAMTKLDYIYKAWRNRTEQTATTLSLYDDAGTTVDQKATVSDDGTTATRTEIITGP